MKTNDPGYVYILTNPSFREDWVKIGKSTRPVDIRSKELDNTAVPLPFEIFATMKTSKFNEVERLVHKTIDRLTDLRIRQNREFFNVDPKVALDIFRDIALTIDDAVITEYEDNKPIIAHPEKKEKKSEFSRPNKRERFKFSMVHIKIGEYITFIPTNLKVKVASDDSIEYDGRIYKLSPFVGTFLPEEKRTPSNAYQGSKYFSYNGKILDDLRTAFEKEADNEINIVENMSEELQQKLRAQLWEVANNLRGNMSANEFMYFSLGFIFYKYLSEKIENYADRALEDDEITFKQLWQSGEEDALELQEEVKKQCLENIGYFVEPQYLFTSIIDAIKRKENIIPSLERSLKRIEDSTLGQESEDDFGGLFSDIDLASPKLGKTTDDKNTLISNVLIALNGIDFGADEATQIDILGDAYEYMISQFAAGAGKKAGEFYTPQEVSQILAEIVTIGHTRLRNVYDPTCGSGSLLIRAAHTGRAYEIFGQEKNPTTYNLCRMNMLLHGIKFSNFQIENGDTLEADAFGDTQFDAVVANPPFSAEWSAADKFNNDDRFSRAGRLAPRKTADYAFILHMLYHLVDGGTMACVVPHGVLFRGNAEGVIRRFLIEKKNCIDAIIGLPANIFYGTSIPTCILVMKKCRKEDDNILFIDASKEFEKVKTQNKLRKEHIDKIVDTYRNRTEIEKYSHLATLQEVADNDYNLNIPRYVDTFEEEEPIDIKAVMAEIKELEAKRADLDKEIEGYLRELGIVE